VRVAGHTYAYRDRPLAEALDELAGLDLEFVEIWLGHATTDSKEVARALTERGLNAAAVSAGGLYSGETSAPARAFELALTVRAPIVAACITPSLLPAIAGTVPRGVTLCVENHWDQPLATAVEVGRAIEGRPAVKACLDTGHALLAGVAPEHFASTLGARLGHVHLKDARRPTLVERSLGRRLRRRLLARPEPVFPGQGALELGRVRTGLMRAGYDRTVTLEHEGPEPTAALAELLRQWNERADAGHANGP
jgi:sugar phosphate isomerase/epimerase